MAFDPNKHLRTIGKEKDGTPRVYLDVKWRIVWFRETYPLGAIDTELFSLGDVVYVRARVIVDGVQITSGMATVRAAGANEQSWAGREIEKAETGAIGRALALAGFGTQFSGDDGDDLADAPVEQTDGYNPADDKPAQPKSTARRGPMLQNATDRWNTIITEGRKHKHYQHTQHVAATYSLLKQNGNINDELSAADAVAILHAYGELRDKGMSEQEALDGLSEQITLGIFDIPF